MEELLNWNWCIRPVKIREIVLHMLFQITINVHNVLHMKKVFTRNHKRLLKNRKVE